MFSQTKCWCMIQRTHIEIQTRLLDVTYERLSTFSER